MVETGGRNPPLPPNFVISKQLPDDRSLPEEKPDNRPLLPPNYVSLRQLRERRLKEEQEKEKRQERVKTSDDLAQPCPNYIAVRQLEEQLLKEAKEKEKQKEEEKEMEGNGNGREELAGDRPLLPPNYISLKQLQAQRLKEEKVKEGKKEKARKEEEEKGGNYSANVVSLRQLKELRLQENEQKGGKEKGRLQQTKVQEEDYESGKIEKKTNNKLCYRLRNLHSKKPEMKANRVWAPVLSPAGTNSSTGTSLADIMFLPENTGVSLNVVMPSSDQNGNDAVMKPKNMGKWKHTKKKNSRKMTSDKEKNKQVKGPECSIEVTDLKNGEAANASNNATKVVTLSQHDNNAVRTVKEGKTNLAESSSPSVPVCVEVKKFNGAPSRKFKTHKCRDKMKAKEIKLSESVTNVISMGEVMKGCDGPKEVTGTKIENSNEQKGKGKMVKVPESSDQILNHEEAKEVNGTGDLIGSEIGSGEVKEKSRNVNMSESSQMGGQLGGHWWKRNQAAGIRGRGHPKAGRLPVWPAEHLRGGGGLLWVPKN